MDLGGFGCGIFRLGVGGIEKRDNTNYLLGEVEDNRLAVYLGYGRSVSNYDVGLAVNLDHHTLDDYSATSSPGLSFSISRRLEPSPNWVSHISTAVNGRNVIRPRMKLADVNVTQPYGVEAGASVTLLPKPAWDHSVTLSTGITKIDMIDPQLAVGLEYTIQDRLQVRGALRDGEVSFGAGLTYRSIKLDYAMVDRDLGGLHTFSISADLGVPVSEKRRVREERRETEFNDLINRRLSGQNRQMISRLVARGEELIEKDDLEQAGIILDRALFLAAGSGLDTMTVYKIAMDAKAKVERAQLQSAFAADMDSARIRFNTGDYLGAKYFADLGLAKLPDSEDARRLRDRADAAVRQNITKEQMVESRLLLADSLMSYGRYDEALVTVRALSAVAEDDGRIKLAMRKAEFGRYCEQAEAAYSLAEYDKANAALDSALDLFPEHPRCLSLRGKIDQALARAPAATPVGEEAAPEPLSEELRGEIEATYKSGQDLFERGNLPEAVAQWEKVERLAPGYMSVREYLVNAYKFLGVELYTQSQLEEAVAIWKKAARLDPDSSEIANYIKRTEGEIATLEELSYEYR
jgi:tetratricopeptide (TPR) repeat protein